MSDIIINDNTEAVKGLILEALENGLEKIGMVAESYAKDKCPVSPSGGALRNSITHKVDPGERCVYIGTDFEYGIYVELGTGAFASNGGGRPGWWVYVPGSGSGKKGNGKVYTFEEAKRVVAILKSKGIDAHMTQGMRPRPYLKPAASEHLDEYAAILRRELG